MDGRFVSYLRVSTERQGRSGLGIEAQREAVTQFLNGGDWKLLAEFTEIESGKRDDRPELAKALAHCRRTGATLVIARLDCQRRRQMGAPWRSKNGARCAPRTGFAGRPFRLGRWRVGRRPGGSLTLFALGQPITLAVHLQNVDVVREAIQ
jgi:hypothetical protein